MPADEGRVTATRQLHSVSAGAGLCPYCPVSSMQPSLALTAVHIMRCVTTSRHDSKYGRSGKERSEQCGGACDRTVLADAHLSHAHVR